MKEITIEAAHVDVEIDWSGSCFLTWWLLIKLYSLNCISKVRIKNKVHSKIKQSKKTYNDT